MEEALRKSVLNFNWNKPSFLNQRYFIPNQLIDLLIENDFNLTEEGKSVNKQPIYSLTLGTGKTKVLAWSQMHGNETTTTRALIDFLMYYKKLQQENKLGFLENLSIKVIPILNPDGAKAYTRYNANKVDLNRDALTCTEPESQVLQQLYTSFKPDFCLNLHDQRTIFSAGGEKNPAILSFLAPAYNKETTINNTRLKSMAVITAVNKVLQEYLPAKVGRYDDAFNPNCIGDRFTQLGTPTILFEAGHWPGDYQRKKTVDYCFLALFSALRAIEELTIAGAEHGYFKIPENEKNFYDIIIRNVVFCNNLTDVAIQYNEVLEDKTLKFVPFLVKTGNLSKYYGHSEITGNNKKMQINKLEYSEINVKIENIALDNENYIDFLTLN
ncbi:MAG: M14 family zinc carboxypeptidase [Mesonia hippocampi]|uniref:M14 family zinc carboxypeptidase n=1 Tax=Mesonia hippocampi TaxID=1628250 RepID=UPI003F9AB549